MVGAEVLLGEDLSTATYKDSAATLQSMTASDEVVTGGVLCKSN